MRRGAETADDETRTGAGVEGRWPGPDVGRSGRVSGPSGVPVGNGGTDGARAASDAMNVLWHVKHVILPLVWRSAFAVRSFGALQCGQMAFIVQPTVSTTASQPEMIAPSRVSAGRRTDTIVPGACPAAPGRVPPTFMVRGSRR